MRRREFLGVLGASAPWPFSARAQRPAAPMIGFLRSTSLAEFQHLVIAFRPGLKETGFVEGQNVRIEFRAAEDDLDRLPALVADLVGRPVNVIRKCCCFGRSQGRNYDDTDRLRERERSGQ